MQEREGEQQEEDGGDGIQSTNGALGCERIQEYFFPCVGKQ